MTDDTASARSLPAGEERWKIPVTHDGVHRMWTEEVRGTAGSHPQSTGIGLRLESPPHVGTHSSLTSLGDERKRLRHWTSDGSVSVEVLDDHECGIGLLYGTNDALLQRREVLRVPVVRRR